jgi:hypothetical protein
MLKGSSMIMLREECSLNTLPLGGGTTSESCPMWPKAESYRRFAGLEAEAKVKEWPTMERGTLPIVSDVFRDMWLATFSQFPSGAKPLFRHEAAKSVNELPVQPNDRDKKIRNKKLES